MCDVFFDTGIPFKGSNSLSKQKYTVHDNTRTTGLSARLPLKFVNKNGTTQRYSLRYFIPIYIRKGSNR
jgi:hypothetical protein